MAFDKIVDSAALDAGMSIVADAIRAKAGTTDPLAWPDGFKASVEGIQTGGGAVDFAPFSKIAWGTITPATDLSGMIPASMFGLESVLNIQFASIQIASDSPANTGNILYAYAYSVNKTGDGTFGSKVGIYQSKSSNGTGKILIEYGSNFFISQILGAGETYRYMICVE